MNTLTYEEIYEAHDRIKDLVHKTPIMTCQTMNELASQGASTMRKLFFKCENFQKIGAFKYRGATNAVIKYLKENPKTSSVVTHSSGNHAQALSLAAKSQGLKAYIVMPKTSPSVKQKAVIGYGGEVLLCEPTMQAREAACQQVQTEKSSKLIHPFNDFYVMAGQGTIVLELQEQLQTLKDIQCILVPIGGGGLCAGVSLAAKTLNPNMKIIGSEPEQAADAKRSLESGELYRFDTTPKSVADGLLPVSLGSNTWPIIQKNVDFIFTVKEDEIKEAMRLVWERMKIIIEPSSAVPVAVALFNKEFKELPGLQNVVIILSGGNCDLQKLPF